MALTTSDILARVKKAVAVGLPTSQRNSLDFDISMCIPGALERLGNKIAESKNYHLLRKDFVVVPVAGVADLSAVAGLIATTIKKRGAIRLTSGSTPIVFCESLNDLYATHPTDVIVVALFTNSTGAALRFSDTANSITGFATSITITANYVPTVAQVPGVHENDFIDMVIELFNQRSSNIVPDPEEMKTA